MLLLCLPAYFFAREGGLKYYFKFGDIDIWLICVLGFPGTIIAGIKKKQEYQREHERREREEKERERRYTQTYGDTADNIAKRIQRSPEIGKLAKQIITLPYLPDEIHISTNYLFWISDHETTKLYYSNLGLSNLPVDVLGTLGEALVATPELSSLYRYKEDGSDNATWNYRHKLVYIGDSRSKVQGW